jgi:hypothetical protein
MGDLISGGSGANGLVSVEGTDGLPLVQLVASATEAVIGAGQKGGRPGRLSLYDGQGQKTVDLLAGSSAVPVASAILAVGGAGVDGTVTVSGTDGQPLVQLVASATEAVIGAGQKGGRPGRLSLYDGKGNLSIEHNAATGTSSCIDVMLTGADCAEQFDMRDGQSPEPGTIVVIDDAGKLRESQSPYDKRVAGVVSGAGEYKPAIVLDRRTSSEGRASVALVGKVYCKVDADPAPIAVGDLLTTSGRPGFAMKAADPAQAFGAVIGKALRPLRAGQGMIPILVALQ